MRTVQKLPASQYVMDQIERRIRQWHQSEESGKRERLKTLVGEIVGLLEDSPNMAVASRHDSPETD